MSENSWLQTTKSEGFFRPYSFVAFVFRNEKHLITSAYVGNWAQFILSKFLKIVFSCNCRVDLVIVTARQTTFSDNWQGHTALEDKLCEYRIFSVVNTFQTRSVGVVVTDILLLYKGFSVINERSLINVFTRTKLRFL